MFNQNFLFRSELKIIRKVIKSISIVMQTKDTHCFICSVLIEIANVKLFEQKSNDTLKNFKKLTEIQKCQNKCLKL